MNTICKNQFEVFYDGDCPLCKREIDMIRRKDRGGQLKLTDIADENFVAEGRTLKELMREIHGRTAKGDFVTGVDVFREIYRCLGFGFLVNISSLPVIRQALDLGYRLFAYFRYRHAMHRMKKQGRDCESCQVKKNSTLGTPS